MAASGLSIEEIIIDLCRKHTGPQRSALLFDLGSKIARSKYRVDYEKFGFIIDIAEQHYYDLMVFLLKVLYV
jgi:hypothetical protein